MNITIAKSNGFSLLEVLFALLIFSVGLLGIAGLQLVAKQNNFDSEERTTAALLASEIAEKIRANPANGSYYVSSVTNITTASLPTTNCSNTTPCTGSALASYDIAAWYKAILGTYKQDNAGNAIGGLVNPSACITQVTGGYTIAIAWRGKVAMTNNSTASTCGQAPTVYGANNAYRRVVVFNITVPNS